MADRARPHVERWNALAAKDAERFRAFLDEGIDAYANDLDGIVSPT